MVLIHVSKALYILLCCFSQERMDSTHDWRVAISQITEVMEQ